jgi:ABC-2 type transport system ATP-binding protein
VTGTGTAVEIHGLEKRYGDRVALAGIDLSIAEGEIFGLLGPNGAGKTTTVEILEGYRRADGGSVRVLGADPQTDAAQLRTQVGVMLQEGGLYPGLRPLELLRLYAAFYDDADDPERLLDVVGLRDAAGTAIRRLSGGQAQRLSLAAALIGRPRLVFLDEPTAGMDPRARADTWELVRELRAGGTTVVLTTHYMDEAEQLCDRIAILDHGRIVAGGSPAEVTAGAVDPCTRFVTDVAIDVAALATRLDRPVTADGTRTAEYTVGGAPSPEVVADLTAWLRDLGVQLVELRTGSASLEEVFLRLTEEPELPAGASRRARTAR